MVTAKEKQKNKVTRLILNVFYHK